MGRMGSERRDFSILEDLGTRRLLGGGKSTSSGLEEEMPGGGGGDSPAAREDLNRSQEEEDGWRPPVLPPGDSCAASSSTWCNSLTRICGGSGLTRDEATTPDRIARRDGALLLPAAAGRCRPPHISNFSGGSLVEEQGRVAAPEVFDVSVRDECSVRNHYEPMECSLLSVHRLRKSKRWQNTVLRVLTSGYLMNVLYSLILRQRWSYFALCNDGSSTLTVLSGDPLPADLAGELMGIQPGATQRWCRGIHSAILVYLD